MKVVSAEFVGSAVRPAGLPEDGLPHIVVAGRSNVGKSSLLNALMRTRLARTAARPGKTRLINLFRVTLSGKVRIDLVDLPGYGHAVGDTDDFDQMVNEYFVWRQKHNRPTLVLLLVDSRHPGLEQDRAAWAWIVAQGLATVVAVTKVDKLTRSERARHFREFADIYNVPLVPVSASNGEGLDALWTTIARQLPKS